MRSLFRHRNYYKKIFKINNLDVNEILVSKEELYGKNNSFKYLIGYNDDVVRPLCIKLFQMIGYVKCFDSNKTMFFKISDNKLLKKYIQIRKNIKNLLNIKFDSEPVYGDNDKYIKTKTKIYDKNVNTNFKKGTKKVPKENKSVCH